MYKVCEIFFRARKKFSWQVQGVIPYLEMTFRNHKAKEAVNIPRNVGSLGRKEESLFYILRSSEYTE
jgi:hypothetical protein